MTTTGFTCSASADARKKFGGLWRDKKSWWHHLGFWGSPKRRELPHAAEMGQQVPLQHP